MKNLYLIIIFILFTFKLYAVDISININNTFYSVLNTTQTNANNKTIVQIEYFIDTDPGLGNGTLINIIPDSNISKDFIIPMTNVSNGFHTLYIRTKDNQNQWSLTINMSFYRMPVTIAAGIKNITKIEYFMDSDPGIGNGTDVAVTPDTNISKDFIIPMTNLSNGFHTLYIRTKDNQNQWSLTHTMPFYRMPVTIAAGIKNITKIEYFMDSDPGIGNGTAVAVTPDTNISKDFIIPMTNVYNGFHTLYIRTRDNQNQWSLTHTMPFYRMPITTNAANKTISKLEYFIDNDPGFGNGVALLVSPDTNISRDFIANLTGLTNSKHTLYIRAKDNENKWSLTQMDTFKICTLPLQTLKPVGNNQLCINSPNSSYTTRRVNETVNYSWRLNPSTAGIISGTDTIATVDWNNTYTGQVYLIAQTTNSCTTTFSDSLLVSIVNQPTAATAPSGNQNVYQGQTGVIYTVTSIANATSYIWTLPGGATGNSTNNSITVNYGASAVSGNITVKGNNICGNGTDAFLYIIVNSLPASAGTIIGNTTVCQGQSNVTYTVPAITNATSYIWTLPSGATGTSTTNSIILAFGSIAVTDSIKVKGHNANGDGAYSALKIIVNPLPLVAGTISGTATVCQGQNSVTYSVPAITNASTYVWTLPTGSSGTSSTASIIVNYGGSAISGNITVKGNNSCGNGILSTKVITVNTTPSVPSVGVVNSCGTSQLTASNYTGSLVWNTGASTSSINVTNSATYTVTQTVNGCISPAGNGTSGPLPVPSAPAVNVQNNCGNSILTASNYTGTLNWSNGATTSSITTTNTATYTVSQTVGGCASANGSGTASPITLVSQTISITAGANPIVTGMSVTFTATLNNTISGQNFEWYANNILKTTTTSLSYSYIPLNGDIIKCIVLPTACYSGATSNNVTMTVNTATLPLVAGAITGSNTVCKGQTGVLYSIPVISNAISYIWTLPSGASGSSSTNSILVDFGINALTDSIKVNGHNSAGDGPYSALKITVNTLPAIAGTISGTTPVCQGQSSVVYKVSTVANATSYTWTLPTGASGTSNVDSIVVSYGTSAVSGNTTVKGTNTCGDGGISTKAITVNPLPATAETITGLASVCLGQSSVTYKVPTVANATSYTWTLPTGASGTSNIDSIVVSYGTSAVNGNITVKGNNACGSGTVSIKAITVNPLPATAGTITGLATVCQGQSNVVYKVPILANSTSYTWTLPTGASGTSTIDSIIVNYGTSAVFGNVTVKGNNTCGSGAVSSKTISVNPLPVVTSQTTSITSGSVFTIAPAGVPAGTTYTWTTPVYTGGVSGGSAQTIGQTNISQTLTIPSGSGTATYTVTPSSGNCSGNTFTVIVSVNQLVSCPPPWIPVQNQQYNMNVIAKLYLSNILTTNNADAIGAFVGNECRGIAYPDSTVNGIVFLTISSNVQSGESVTFKAWRSQLCDECPVSETIPFVNQTEIGTMAIPYEFHCGLVELCNNFGAGYNWFSVNVNPGSMSLNSLFNNLTPCENDRIIGQQSFATYYGSQWVGSLTTIDPKAMYKLKLCSQQTWCKLGLPVNIQPITVASGYPWIGYLPQTNLAINTALSGISPSPISNDRFNAQSSFATYSGSQWIGSLTSLQKGKGYIIHLASPSVLTYPATSSKSAIIIENNLTKALSTSDNVKTNARYNMQIVADILLPNGNISINSADTVYAYVGNECRGISSPLAGLNGRLFLTVGSDIEQGEVIHFKIFVSSLNQLFDVTSNLIFASEMETGTMGNPYHFDLTGGSVGISLNNNQNGISFGDIYPNPFDKTASLDFNIYNAGKVEGRIINGLGIEIQTIVSKDYEAGSYILKIDGEILSPGIYTLLINYQNKQNSFSITRKMIVK